ncbi:DNA-binding protein [Enterobacteriaceae bacterium ML5]|nr:DNA-binding protein [Enterobacteriaceae bacterium ML5]
MAKKLKTTSSVPNPALVPGDYPFGDRVTESIADYAKRMGVSVTAIRRRVDRGSIPVVQSSPGAIREINLYAIFLNAKYKAERYAQMMN